MERFHHGDLVEVTSTQEGFLGSYFEARIIKQTEKDEFLVEYTKLYEEDNEKCLLREVVPRGEIRPMPPNFKASYFNISDQVDVFQRDGWWYGIITGRDPIRSKRTGEDRSIYSVYDPLSGEVIEYRKWELRAHLERINGNWISSRVRRNSYGCGSGIVKQSSSGGALV
ncbi:hypothetical protein MKX01_013087 [Papaver californicum]|nr:hypothetical protein MKX01_033483 [Papaver californicum]KAI3962283.1 hypothetical protein MKX01_033484 [Papaver californicum]KAI3978289.1 hypothetical protein MKX01_013087 [Papaver californicum]